VAEAQGLNEVKEAAKALGRDLLGANVGYRSDLSTPEYITRLYETFLRRAPDGNAASWQTQADQQGRSYVLEQFLAMSAYSERSGALYREIFWLVSDHLGTPRMIAGRTGKVEGVKRRDYLPFGEEIAAGTGGRTTAQGYGQLTGNREQWATYERDEETGLDYAQARYYAPAQGRFTSPDEFTGGPDELYDFADDASENPTFYAELDNPQSLNKYQYTYNNPLNMTDPDGHCPWCVVALEVGSTIADVVTTVRTLRDPNASRAEQVATTAGAIVGIIAPGGGYGVAAKGLVKAFKALTKADKAVDVAKGLNKADNAVDVAKNANKAKQGRTSSGRPTDANGRPLEAVMHFER
jgi:RHS repeat-associated protein